MSKADNIILPQIQSCSRISMSSSHQCETDPLLLMRMEPSRMKIPTKTEEGTNEDDWLYEPPESLQRRLMLQHMKHEEFRYVGAAGSLYKQRTCELWNLALANPRHYLYIPCPELRSKYLFDKRQARNLYYKSYQCMASPCIRKGMRNVIRMLQYTPELIRESILEMANDLQNWIYSDPTRYLRFLGDGSRWEDRAEVALKEFLDDEERHVKTTYYKELFLSSFYKRLSQE